MSFSYRYLAGYGPTGRGANLSVSIGGTTVYASPPLDRYNYSDPSDPPHTAYSPAVAVAATGLPLTVPAAGARIEVRVWNNDRNVQLLLPLDFEVGCATATCAAAGPWRPAEPTTVFKGGDKGPAGTDETNTTGNCFRIPQVARAPDGELLAFAEGRYASCWPDVRPENRIVMRRSVDGGLGHRWGPIQVLWGRTAAERGRGLNYPMPLVDGKRGRVTLIFYQAGGPIWRMVSADSGKTWSSAPTNMSAVPGFGASGGGKGIQLPGGRLLFACGGTACYSDDGGETWRKGQQAALGPGVGGFGEETIVADGRTDSSLAMFIRSGSRSPLINHAVASSLDGGETWGPARLLPSVVGVTCQGSVAAAGGAAANGQLLLAAPFSTDLSGYGQNGRENLAVWSYRLNATNTGPTGPDPEPALVARLYPCRAAYSSFMEDGSLNLFEGGPDMRYQQIMLVRLNTSFPSPN